MTLPKDALPPIGSVVAFAGPSESVPSGWMICDGRKLPKDQYDELFHAIGTSWGGDGSHDFYLPDLRGQFIRGVDRKADGTEEQVRRDPDRDSRYGFLPPDIGASPGNPGNKVGSFQHGATARPAYPFITDTPGNHHHGDPTWNGKPGPYELATVSRGFGAHDYGSESAPTSEAGTHTHKVISGGDTETRPVNAYVNFIIRVR